MVEFTLDDIEVTELAHGFEFDFTDDQGCKRVGFVPLNSSAYPQRDANTQINGTLAKIVYEQNLARQLQSSAKRHSNELITVFVHSTDRWLDGVPLIRLETNTDVGCSYCQDSCADISMSVSAMTIEEALEKFTSSEQFQELAKKLLIRAQETTTLLRQYIKEENTK